MKFLLDTNVISELTKTTPHKGVIELVQSTPQGSLFLSVLTLGELKKGITRLNNDPIKQKKLLMWFENDMKNYFGDQILPITSLIADRWGSLVGRHNNPVPAIDSLIAATALTHNLIIITRNVKDFELYNIEIINPWA